MVDINLISIIAFYAIIALLILKHRKKLIVQHKIFLLFKTKFGIKLIDKIARFKKFWKYWGYAAIPVGFVGMIAVVVLLVTSLVKLVREPSSAAGVSLVLPGVRVPGSSIFLPFWYGIISIVVLILIHEGAHGVIARAHNIKVKSTGVGLLVALPLAFVEPDEKQLARKPLATKLSVFAAGPFANLCLGFIMILVLGFMVTPALASITEVNGIAITDVLERGAICEKYNVFCPDIERFPANEAGLESGDTVLAVNDQQTTTTEEFVSAMATVKPGDSVILSTDRGEFNVITGESAEDSSRAYLGVSFKQNMALKEHIQSRFGNFPWILSYLSQLLYWIVILNIGVGLINLLPLGPVDGGQMIRATILHKFKNKRAAMRLVSFISMFALLLLLLNIIGPIF